MKFRLSPAVKACLIGMAAFTPYAQAALLDKATINDDGQVVVTGGTIERTLDDQVGTGMGDWYTPGSSSYIIHRDPFRSIRRGRQLFQRKFSQSEGLGPRQNFHSQGSISQTRRLGAGSADSCAACHGNPKGSAGVGGNVATFPDGRDAPHLFGLGLVEQLADETTRDLRETRDLVISMAHWSRKPARKKLKSKGISFGYITGLPDGTVDTSEVEGVDEDLRVRPFFAQGATFSMREFIVGALKDEMGLETWDPVLCQATDPNNPTKQVSEAGMVFDPALDTIERPPVCDPATDGDNDGIVAELDPALVDHLEFYLLNYFKPATFLQTKFEKKGLRAMKQIGCTSCHIQNLTIENDRRVADVETAYDMERGILNTLFATAQPLFNVVEDSEPYPALVPKKEKFVVKNIFTDMKRHDLGPNFWERDYDGSIQKLFVTEPLWGAGTTAPYGHDGRSISLDQVIRRHGGEAQAARNAYVSLPVARQRQITAFLQSLVLFPPDDTASNLNPGNRYTTNPQEPSEHGSIRLPALFQIPEYGVE